MFVGPKPQQLTGQLGGQPKNTDKTFGLICGGVAVAGKIALGVPVELTQKSDLVALGIDAAYDANNKVLVKYHVEQYFEYCPDGRLFLMLVPMGTKLAEMVSAVSPYDAGDGALYKLMTDETTRREIKSVGIVLNPLADYAPVLLTGLDKDVLDAIPVAQATVTALKAEFIYLDSVILEGRELNGTFAALKDLTTLAAACVSVVIGADPVIQALDAEYAKTAAVGTVIGMLAVRRINENLGSVAILNPPDAYKGSENYSLTRTATGLWLSAALSSGVKFSTLSQADQQLLTEKGFIYMGSYSGYPGIYCNESPTCVDTADDYSVIEHNRVWNKAARYLRSALIPKMKGVYKKNPTTGYPLPTVIAYWTQLAKKKLEQMVIDQEVSAVDVYINPEQTPSKTVALEVNAQVVADGIIYQITIPIGLANSI